MGDPQIKIEIPEKNRDAIYLLLRDYVKDIQKGEIISKIPKSELSKISLLTLIASNASIAEIDELQTSSFLFNEICHLLKNISNNNSLSAVNLIYTDRLNPTKIWLNEVRASFLRAAVGINNYSNFVRLEQSDNPEKLDLCNHILSNAFKSKDAKFIKTFTFINKAYFEFPSSLLFTEIDQNVINIMQNDEFIKYVAFLILEPKHQFSFFLDTDPGWNDFPLKWLVSENSLTLVKDLLYYHNKKENLSQYFIQKYEDHKFEDLRNLCCSVYLNSTLSSIIAARTSLIEEAIISYMDNNYASTICLTLPLIEGIIWDFAIH